MPIIKRILALMLSLLLLLAVPVLAQKTVEQVLRSYGIVAGKDFQVEILKRKSASELFEIEGNI